MSLRQFSANQLDDYRRDGFVLVRELFDAEEMSRLLEFARQDEDLVAGAYGRKDSTGQETKLALRNEAGDDLYGMFARSGRMVEPIGQLLEGEVYLYHLKMMLKEPRVGGAWEWHQDYGYWYNFGCLSPALASCLIAVTPSNKENGCLQVLVGSQQLGRIDHNTTGDQAGADMERVEAAMQRFELRHIEAEPGDALFFHCNLLHRSDQNRSEHPRWSLICCYNAAVNDPYKESKHARYSPLDLVSDAAIKNWASTT